MNISPQGIAFLKRAEGTAIINGMHVVYNDATGRPVPVGAPLPVGATIGYGHLLIGTENYPDGISEQYATELLIQDVAIAERTVRNAIATTVPQHQFDALVSLAFNIGHRNFTDSTLVKYINFPDYHSTVYPNAQTAWCAWCYCHGRISVGLQRRRANEWRLYTTGQYT